MKNIISEAVCDQTEFANVDNDFVQKLNGNYYEVVVPDSCLPYLINGETEGYTEDELNDMDEFVGYFNGKLRDNLQVDSCCIPLDGESPDFYPFNDVYGNVGCDCYKFCLPAAVNESKNKRNTINKSKKDALSIAQQIVDEVNKAYHEASNRQGGDSMPLMDNEGNSYGLTSDIRIDKRGYIVFPFDGFAYKPMKIRILSKSGGTIRLLQGDYYTEGWRDASKILKSIIKDAMRGIKYFEQYDPNWETSDTEQEYKNNLSSLKNMNKSIGLKAGTGKDYISKPL